MREIEAVRRLQAGDKSALAVLYSAYAEAAVRTAFLITHDRAAAEDAVQEAFVQVMRNAPTLRDPASFRPWFYRIVVNAAKRLSRHMRHPLPVDLQKHDEVDLCLLTPEEVTLGSEEIQMVRSAVAELTEAHREVIVLRYYTDLSDEEIAQALGVPGGTVKSRLHRAREALHESIGGTIKPMSAARIAVPADRLHEQKG